MWFWAYLFAVRYWQPLVLMNATHFGTAEVGGSICFRSGTWPCRFRWSSFRIWWKDFRVPPRNSAAPTAWRCSGPRKYWWFLLSLVSSAVEPRFNPPSDFCQGGDCSLNPDSSVCIFPRCTQVRSASGSEQSCPGRSSAGGRCTSASLATSHSAPVCYLSTRTLADLLTANDCVSVTKFLGLLNRLLAKPFACSFPEPFPGFRWPTISPTRI